MKNFALAALISLALAAPVAADEWTMIKAPLKTAPDVVMHPKSLTWPLAKPNNLLTDCKPPHLRGGLFF